MKMFGILATIGLVAALAFGTVGSGAWFTTSVTQEAGGVSTGDLTLTVQGLPFGLGEGDVIGPAPESPDSYESTGTFSVENTGDYDMKWRGKLNLTTNQNSIASYLYVKAVMDTDIEGCNYGPDGRTELFSGVPLTDFLSYATSPILMDDPTWAFQPGHKACYEIYVRMDPNTPNSVQNSSLAADLIIEGTQRDNPGWTVTQ